MPAIRDLGRVLEVVPAVLALLLALRLSFEHRVVRQVAQLDRELLVDLLGFRFGDLVVSHGVDLPLFDGRDARRASSRARRADPERSATAVTAGSGPGGSVFEPSTTVERSLS